MRTIALSPGLSAFFIISFAGVVPLLHGHDVKGERFLYDGAAWIENGTMLDGKTLYEPGVARVGDRFFATMLKFTPGEGDRIVVGEWRDGEIENRQIVTKDCGQYRKPNLTVDVTGTLWLSYESLEGDRWQVLARRATGELVFGESVLVSSGDGSGINHAAAASRDEGIAIVWQADRGGQWDILFRTIDGNGRAGAPQTISSNPLGDWHPSITASTGGEYAVAWDSYDGESFSVWARTSAGNDCNGPIAVANTKAFEGRPSIICDRDGKLFISWEEGAINWGKEYRGSLRDIDLLNDVFGPVHRFRLLRVAELAEDGSVVKLNFPMPTLETAAAREGAVEGRQRLGTYYERGQLTVDDANRLWIVYRHYFFPEVALPGRPTSHVEEGWRLYARCFAGGKWSELVALEPNQRDGMQRLSLAPGANGLTAFWTTGRTHRGDPIGPHGVAVARVEATSDLDFLAPEKDAAAASVSAEPSCGIGKRGPDFPPEIVGDITYRLFMGDLHRHTDLSLCRVYFDGSLDDAYRYAIEAGELDFLGITDHCRDMSNGDAQSQLWWRSTKEVTRHRLKGAFFPLYAFERSNRETDHNVVTLRSDILRPYQPPLKEFWKEIDTDTFTIPHNPIRPLTAFAYHDDEKRPLLEIYQGCRDNPMHKQAHAGLLRGYHMGFIASSDHLATSTSFACVWSPAAGAEPIFRSLQARRTYGATAKIRLVFRSDDHWMGEIIAAKKMPGFRFAVDGAGPIEKVEVVRDGEVVMTFTNEEGGNRMVGSFAGQGEFAAKQYFYIHVLQEDGEQAWSSPIWVERVIPD